MKISVLVENSACEGFRCEHGLSLLVDFNSEKYLIDTGASGLFSENSKKMGIDLKTVKTGFLSHAHYDHSGGYKEFFEANQEAKVYLQSASKRNCFYKIVGPLKKNIGIPNGTLDKYNDRFEYVDGYLDLGNGVYLLPHSTPGLEATGRKCRMYTKIEGNVVPDDFSHEQTIVFDNPEGLVLISSCSHAGVENIIEEVKEKFDKKILAFFGGFHMMGAAGANSCRMSKMDVMAVGKNLMGSSEAVFYSGHCTGTVAFPWLKEVMGERLQAMHTGMMVEI